MLCTERVLEFAADENLDADSGGVQSHRVVDVHGDLFVGEFLAQDAGAAAGAQHHRLGPSPPVMIERKMPRATEQRIAERQQRHDGEVDALKPVVGS